jgi:hypothetical protein
MIKDLFAEMIRRLEWAKDRRLEAEVQHWPSRRVCRIPIDESQAYIVSVRADGDHRTLLQSFFPDGGPHHHMRIDRLDMEEAACLLDAAGLIVYGSLIPHVDGKKSSR